MPPSRALSDPEARLLRKGKGKEAKLVFMAHALMENRHGMLVDYSDHPSGGYGGAGYCAGVVGRKRGSGAFIPERWAETKATTPGTAWRTCAGVG